MIRLIPTQRLCTCDRCGAECSESLGIHAKGIEGGTSYNGDTGGGPFTLDLCERCAAVFHSWLIQLLHPEKVMR